jgi:cellulase
MRSTTLLALATCTTSVLGHCLFQRVSIDGVDQGSLVGVRTPAVNNPVLNVAIDAISCNTGLLTPVSTKVLTVPAGSKVGAWFQHVIGGPQYNPDPDNPIASSHKGPISVYLAPVSDASTAAGTGQKWFKIAEEGLDTTTGKWAVDSMIAGNGWWNFTMPSCIAAGQYLMRVELIALHSAYSTGGAQFYLSYVCIIPNYDI